MCITCRKGTLSTRGHPLRNIILVITVSIVFGLGAGYVWAQFQMDNTGSVNTPSDDSDTQGFTPEFREQLRQLRSDQLRRDREAAELEPKSTSERLFGPASVRQDEQELDQRLQCIEAKVEAAARGVEISPRFFILNGC